MSVGRSDGIHFREGFSTAKSRPLGVTCSELVAPAHAHALITKHQQQQ